MSSYTNITDMLPTESPDSPPNYVYPSPLLGGRSMSPTPSRDIAQPTSPEPKSSSGLASSIFKSFVGGGKSKSAQPSSTNGQKSNGTSSAMDDSGPPDLERYYEQLKADNPLPDRVSAAEALKYAVQDYPLEGVTSIFKAGRDLIQPTNPQNARMAGYELLKACVRHEISSDPQRLDYFEAISAEGHPDDFHLRLDALVELARHGKDLSGFRYGVIPLLTKWLKNSFAIATKNRKAAGRQQRVSKVKIPVGEETNLALLFAFTVDVIKFGFNVSNGQNTNGLIDVILYICVHTPLPNDLKACIAVIDAIIIYGEMPTEKLADCVKVLCSIHGVVNEVQPEAWRSISSLGKSHHGQVTVRVLLDLLRDCAIDPAVHEKQQLREIRGAISVLQKLFSKNAKDGYPLVPFTLLMGALANVIAIEHTRIENDVLNLILSILNDDTTDSQAIMHNVMEEDWSVMFNTVKRCSTRIMVCNKQYDPSRIGSPLSKEENSEQNAAKTLSYTLDRLINRIEELLKKFPQVDFFQREDCIQFLLSIHQHLTESASAVVVNHFIHRRYCYPSDLHRVENITALLKAFFADRSRPLSIRLQALKAVTGAYKAVYLMEQQFMDPDYVECVIKAILNDIGDEKETDVLQEVMSVAVMVTEFADVELFTWVINAIRASITTDRLQSPLGSPTASQHSMSGTVPAESQPSSTLIQTPSNIVAKGLVHIFMKTMRHSAFKALRAFDELLWIAQSQDCEKDARITALKMLFRLRADWGNWIFLTPFTESDGLAASLYRTQASLARKQAADDVTNKRLSKNEESATPRATRTISFGQNTPQARQPTRSASGVQRTLMRNHQMWMSPDPEALPEPTSGENSEILVSAVEASGDEEHTATFSHAVEQMKQARLRTIARKSEPDYVEGEKELISEAKYNEMMSYYAMSEESKEETDQTELDQKKARPIQKPSPTPLNISVYLETVINLMQHGCDWEVYSYILVHLPSQLTNQALFKVAIPQIKILRGVLCDQLKNNSFQDPPVSSGLRKVDVAICLYQILNMVMSYHRHFSKGEDDEIVQAFVKGVGEKTSKSCIHALSICCHELPVSTSKILISLLQKMSQIITQSHIAVHILEFLACLARLPNIYVNFREDEYRIVFAICFRYLQYVRDQNGKDSNQNSQVTSPRVSIASADGARGLGENGESNFQPNTSDELPQYVYSLAYHVIIFWFLSLKLEDRAGQVSWITKNLVFTDATGKEIIDEQAQVTLDFMQRVAYADVEESAPDPEFTPENYGPIKKNRWIIGNSLVTIEQATRGGWGQITKRQPSGTSSYIIREKFNRPPPHQIPPPRDPARKVEAKDNAVLPSHLLLQIAASVPQSAEEVRPLPLPMDDYMERFTRLIERLFTVDSHKVGVIYIGENQTEEVEILANETGNTDYTEFLLGLGTLVKLKDAKFNTQGLDRHGPDGTHVTCWRDRVTEIIFHVTTRMPTDLDNDPRCNRKKSHIGNDFVNIIFNNSGHPFNFDTFPSDFNFVNIVITPESRETFLAARSRSQEKKMYSPFFKVQVMSKPGFPEISPAAETKIVSLEALPGFVRLLALNASVFSLVWANRNGGEHISSWRSRLRELNRVRERYTPKPAPAATSPPGTANGVVESKNMRETLMLSMRRSSVAFIGNNSEPAPSQRSSVLSTAETEVGPSNAEGGLVATLDFSRWAAPK